MDRKRLQALVERAVVEVKKRQGYSEDRLLEVAHAIPDRSSQYHVALFFDVAEEIPLRVTIEFTIKLPKGASDEELFELMSDYIESTVIDTLEQDRKYGMSKKVAEQIEEKHGKTR